MHDAIEQYQEAVAAQQAADDWLEEARRLWQAYPDKDKGMTKAFKRFEHACEQVCSLSTKTNLARRKMVEAIDEAAKES